MIATTPALTRARSGGAHGQIGCGRQAYPWRSGVLIPQGRGQIAMGLGLREQGIGLCFEGLRGVVASGEASRRFLEPGELHDGLGELGRIAALLAILAVPLKSEVS